MKQDKKTIKLKYSASDATRNKDDVAHIRERKDGKIVIYIKENDSLRSKTKDYFE